MFPPISLESNYSNLFFVEQSLNEPSPPRTNTPIVVNSTEKSGSIAYEMVTLSSIAPPETLIVTIDYDFFDCFSIEHVYY